LRKKAASHTPGNTVIACLKLIYYVQFSVECILGFYSVQSYLYPLNHLTHSVLTEVSVIIFHDIQMFSHYWNEMKWSVVIFFSVLYDIKY
jgi:hypothetical protein